MDAESSELVILVYNTHSHTPSMIGIHPHQVVHTVHTCRPNPRHFFFVLVLFCVFVFACSYTQVKGLKLAHFNMLTSSRFL